jgi:hypothetical protein
MGCIFDASKKVIKNWVQNKRELFEKLLSLQLE